VHPPTPGHGPTAHFQRDKRHDKCWKRYEKQLPGHRVQIEPIAGANGAAAGATTFQQLWHNAAKEIRLGR
jgi:hypothetical protein